MDVDAHLPLFATRTKPVESNKFKKRLGAKTAKKLELKENSASELNPTDATMYRALAARCNDLSQDRPDISCSSKELCREFSVPNKSCFAKLKTPKTCAISERIAPCSLPVPLAGTPRAP